MGLGFSQPRVSSGFSPEPLHSMNGRLRNLPGPRRPFKKNLYSVSCNNHLSFSVHHPSITPISWFSFLGIKLLLTCRHILPWDWECSGFSESLLREWWEMTRVFVLPQKLCLSQVEGVFEVLRGSTFLAGICLAWSHCDLIRSWTAHYPTSSRLQILPSED